MSEQTVTLEIRESEITLYWNSRTLSLGYMSRDTGEQWRAIWQDTQPADQLAATAWMAALLLRLPHELGEALRGVNLTVRLGIDPQPAEPYGAPWFYLRLSDATGLWREDAAAEPYLVGGLIGLLRGYLRDHLAPQPGTAAERTK